MYRPDTDAVDEIVETLKQSLGQSIEFLVPWFYSSMPDYYYASTSREERVEHLHAILTNRVLDSGQTAILTGGGGERATFITAADRPDVFSGVCMQLGDREIHEADITTSADGRVLLAAFDIDDPPGCGLDHPDAADRIRSVAKAGRSAGVTEEDARAFLERTRPEYLAKSPDDRVLRHIDLLSRLDDAHVCRAMTLDFDNRAYRDTTRISVGIYTRERTRFLHRLARQLETLGLRILRGYVDSFGYRDSEAACVVSLYVVDASGKQIGARSRLRTDVEQAIRAIPWTPQNRLEELVFDHAFRLDDAGLVGAACEFVHQMLGKANRYVYSLENCMTAVLRYPEIARAVAGLFRARFAPGKKRKKAGTSRSALETMLEEVADPLDREILSRMADFPEQVLKTNFFVADKLGLAFRMAPESLDEKHYPEKPFGYFYFFGASHKGFHVRFRDMARGGVRIVPARTREHHALESSRLFDEVYSLAVAQQLKNKDIPEGGSKSVILVDLGGDVGGAVRASIDSLLDIIVADEKGSPVLPEVVDRYGREEIIYLGPDENMTDDLIVWIVERAAARGYRYAGAFMSSKPGAGINHKEYGVTSEGVIVYLEKVLRRLGTDPYSTDFTVKMTGGPDGDVAGNAIRLMVEKYGRRARIVAISDGSGCASDPAGLDHRELMRLVRAGKPVVHFSTKRLSGKDGAFVRDASGKNSRIRDRLHNEITADVFLPAGGRPATVNDENWREFLHDAGTPTARTVVEGANIFLTPGARERLEEAGVVIIKDSSANKCGVICSSYEVLANLVVDEEEFLAVKEAFVDDVLAILRERAGAEADLLLGEWDRSGRERGLIELSMAVSREINIVTDRVTEILFDADDDPADDPLYRALIRDYCPPVLVEKYGDRVPDRIPRPHRIALVAARIASKIVYQQGLGWVNDAMMERLPELVHAYLEQERLNAACIDEVSSSKLPHREDVAAVLREAGLRTLIRRRTGLG